MGPKGWSIPATSRRVLELLGGLDWSRARVADVGAGRGAFSHLLAEWLRERGIANVRDHVLPCDVIPESFQAEGLSCARVGADGRLPLDDASVDAAVAIEVIEHVEDQFAFVREMARIIRPGGLVLLTTPNVLSMRSRWRTLVCGFPELFDPLPSSGADPRILSGHIHPISPYYLAQAALRAGLEAPRLYADRMKRSSAVLVVLSAPLLVLGALSLRGRLARKHPEVLEENRPVLAQMQGWKLLTSRTSILLATRPV